MKSKIRELKTRLKVHAATIRVLKGERRRYPDGLVYGLWQAQREFRHLHIVRCLLRGRTLEQIEPKHRMCCPIGEDPRPERPVQIDLVERYWREYTGLEYPEMPTPPPRKEAADAEALRAGAG